MRRLLVVSALHGIALQARLAGNGDGLFGKEMDSDVVNLTAEKTQPVIVAKEHDEENAELWDKLCAIAGRGLGCSASLHTGSRCQHETGPWVEMGASSQSDSACEKPWELQSSVDGLRFQVVADRNFQKGEQLTFDYGHSKNIELLVSYGFVIPRNAADTVALYESGEDLVDDDRWTPSSNLRVLRRKEMLVYEAITRSTAKPEDLLGVRGDGSGQAPELCELLRILHADSTELEMLAGTRDPSSHLALSEETEQSVAEHIARRCEELLAEFPTTMEEDVDLQAELSELASERGASEDLSVEQTRKQLALSFRIS
ncbi:hypothetical protein CYMTET_16973, partial [Cymbomonas tetramitiformis]